MPNDARLMLLDRDTVAGLLTHDVVLEAVTEAFRLHSQGAGRVFPVVRETLPGGGVFGIKSGDVPAEGLLGFKAAGFWPGNRAAGGEPHQATIVLVDPATGRPRGIVDGNAITTYRTGAAGAIGLKLLARPDSASACLFGTGVQAAIQLDFALRTLPDLRTVRYLGSSGRANADFEARFADRCDIAMATHADTAVAASDVVICATPGRGPLFGLQAVRAGTHINAVGADTRGKRELPSGLLERARLFVDDRVQARQIGELQWLPDAACTEVGDLLCAARRPPRGASDITVFDMTGIALQDLTVARLVLQRAASAGVGTVVAWPW
ncbi:ornithine cyclodeaminase family protein [Xylophilus sp. GOD-11R]|uniref:ornithine cyclodeaminase family protein n=1 Tax=Xylophilus sp. GOD-11R TaxID=3089814 RepID=UPI00298C65C4|nr:ornithine cyclodeaminase family protein [Xylophilus sp. GOD-11R]WPB59031.1 ornithine cyclodeaminase family protein [Xylophilus sp. GOD-11R]